MTTPTTDTPGTAVALKRDAVGVLPPAYQAALEIRKREAMMFAEVSKQSWGTNLDQNQRRAIAAFCQRHNLDPSMIDLLGGRLYRNGAFYFDRLAKMVATGKVEYAFADYITLEPRLDRIAADTSDPERAKAARIEKNRREDERVRWQVPDEALAACVFRVKLQGMQEIAGCKPVLASGQDPVGKSNPVTTAETRSARRALRKVIEISPELKQLYETVEVDWRALASQVTVGDVEDDERSAPVALPGGATFRAAGAKTTPLISHGDGYDAPETPVSPMREPGEDDEDIALDLKLAAEEAKPKKGK